MQRRWSKHDLPHQRASDCHARSNLVMEASQGNATQPGPNLAEPECETDIYAPGFSREPLRGHRQRDRPHTNGWLVAQSRQRARRAASCHLAERSECTRWRSARRLLRPLEAPWPESGRAPTADAVWLQCLFSSGTVGGSESQGTCYRYRRRRGRRRTRRGRQTLGSPWHSPPALPWPRPSSLSRDRAAADESGQR